MWYLSRKCGFPSDICGNISTTTTVTRTVTVTTMTISIGDKSSYYFRIGCPLLTVKDYSILFVIADHMGSIMCPQNTQTATRTPSALVMHKTSSNMSLSQNSEEIEKLLKASCIDPTKKYSLADFCLKGLLGQGAYASVFKAELKQNMRKGIKKDFALKKVGKKKLFDRNLVDHLKVEKRVLSQIKSNFIVRLNFAFQDASNCYFVMECAEGGNVYDFMNNPQQSGKAILFKGLGESGARFVMAAAVLGLECLHKQGIMYRDLKPQNILVFADGYPKLSDFGLSKKIDTGQTSNTMAGTQIYFAPEVMNKKGHTMYVDFWTLGVLLHELILSMPPFDGFSVNNKNFSLLCLKAERDRDWKDSNISEQAKDLISKFLRVTPQKRLGANGFNQIKTHSFFSGFDWVAFGQKKMRSPLQGIVKKYPIRVRALPTVNGKPRESLSYPEIQGITFKEAINSPNLTV